jgi:Skp family chaperone for outer membrane proteins
MRRTMLLAMTALVPGVFLMQTVGSSSVAVVDVDRAVAESAGKDAITKLNAFAADQKVAIQKKAKEAQDIENRLRVQDRALSAAARDQLTKSLEDAQAAVEKLSTEAQDKYDKMQQEVLGPAQQKTIAAINTYASEHSVKIVLDASVLRNGLVYVNDTADITSEIIRRIAANLENPNQKNAADWVGQLAHRQWLPIPSFAPDLRQTDRSVVGRDVERNGR